jgi:hypothetical protein
LAKLGKRAAPKLLSTKFFGSHPLEEVMKKSAELFDGDTLRVAPNIAVAFLKKIQHLRDAWKREYSKTQNLTRRNDLNLTSG